jgi:hypothetical protein
MTVQSPPGYPQPPQPPLPPQPPPPPKKGMGPLGWVLIGCGVIVVVGLIAFGAFAYFVKSKVDGFQKNPAAATAKLMVQVDPDLDLVSEDDQAGTLTVHNKKTNETLTMNFDDIKNGHMKFSTDKGTMEVGGQNGFQMKATDDKGHVSTFVAGAGAPQDMPSWLPIYPGAAVKGGYAASGAQSNAKGFTLTTTDSVDKVVAFYQQQLKSNGLDVQPMSTMSFSGQGGQGGQTNTGIVTAASADKARTAQIMVTNSDGKTQAIITYVETKP